jgi:hypothetical protein
VAVLEALGEVVFSLRWGGGGEDAGVVIPPVHPSIDSVTHPQDPEDQ